MDSGNRTGTPNATTGGANARDLGYLEKFLEKLRSQAAAMPRSDARTRLETLLREETDRWREIAALLESRPVETSASGRSPQPRTAAVANGAVQPVAQPRVTIGSLKRSRG